ncbi:rhodanese-like domain-containing protein [Alteromonadaceae bacterium BrNp21-10]|nr:rhodanese-like domain-containing protein [Alteromonadaceae bacterium BrNp21-10]
MKILFLVCLLCSSNAVFANVIPLISTDNVLQVDPQKTLILDVRSPDEFAEGHVPGAINIPHNEITQQLELIKSFKQESIVLYCRSGRRAGIAASTLIEHGVTQLQHMDGDMLQWQAQQLPIEK